MATLKNFWSYTFGPNIVKIYNVNSQRPYEANAMERLGNHVLHYFNIAWYIGFYTSPLLLLFMHNRGFMSTDGLVTIAKTCSTLATIIFSSYCIRAFGRSNNPQFNAFLTTLNTVNSNYSRVAKLDLNAYNFDFRYWPVEFRANSTTTFMDIHKDERGINAVPNQFANLTGLNKLIQLSFQGIAYAAIHTFGIRLVYPGSLTLLHLILDQSLLQGRSKLIEQNKGERYKIATSDNNKIDTLFIDNRNVTRNGNMLVVCCEGNAGFYEIGIMNTAVDCGYSVIGWNHPGFGASTGRPYPPQEQCAIDAVMQFSTKHLNFSEENILIFGWSIGGYTASWAAVHYPKIRGLILDATFDDILPLAYNQMPSWCSSIVQLAIREHVDLNIYNLLKDFNGPVLLIRRTDDEVICLRPGEISSNRGNHLLIKILQHRYPLLFKDEQMELVKRYLSVVLSAQDEILQYYSVNIEDCQNKMQLYVNQHSKQFPLEIGNELSSSEKNKMALFLLHKHMKDFRSTHCIGLAPELLRVPYSVNEDSDYVFT